MPLAACVALRQSSACADFSRRSRPPRARGRRSGSEGQETKPSKVLMIGRIRELALYRSEYLRTHGFEVIAPQDRQETVDAIRRGGFQVAVLSYTLSNDAVLEFAEMLRQQCPSCPLVVIANTRNEDRSVKPDQIVLADDGPEALRSALQRALQKN